jgi:hypothetical protein
LHCITLFYPFLKSLKSLSFSFSLSLSLSNGERSLWRSLRFNSVTRIRQRPASLLCSLQVSLSQLLYLILWRVSILQI